MKISFLIFFEIVDAEEDTGMVPGQFTPLLTKKFSAHLKQLDVTKVADMTELFVTSLKTNASSVVADIPSCLNVVAMVIENLRWIRFYTFNCLMLHRTSCKMLYVLFGLFTDLLKQVSNVCFAMKNQIVLVIIYYYIKKINVQNH